MSHPEIARATPKYAQIQKEFHEQRNDYGVSGHVYAKHILALSQQLGTKDILDYGCGKATLQKSLPFPIQNYDPFIPEFSARPEAADIVICTDVMEHIEPEFVENVLADVFSLMRKMVFLQIATGPAKKVLPDGRNAHLIQQPVNQWVYTMLPYGHLNALQDTDHGFISIWTPFPSRS